MMPPKSATQEYCQESKKKTEKKDKTRKTRKQIKNSLNAPGPPKKKIIS
jgi:hypothetical protein